MGSNLPDVIPIRREIPIELPPRCGQRSAVYHTVKTHRVGTLVFVAGAVSARF
jgi:hypothetical protein